MRLRAGIAGNVRHGTTSTTAYSDLISTIVPSSPAPPSGLQRSPTLLRRRTCRPASPCPRMKSHILTAPEGSLRPEKEIHTAELHSSPLPRLRSRFRRASEALPST